MANGRRNPRDPWKILGLAPGSPPEAVRTQYLRLVRQNHPDRFGQDPAEKARHEEIMKDVNWAYQEVLRTQAQAATAASRPSSAKTSVRSAPSITLHDLTCRAHGRWAVIFCTVCGEPLCSRCDTTLSGYCAKHRPQRSSGLDWW
jgi:DnaJ-domain-containing protein 1